MSNFFIALDECPQCGCPVTAPGFCSEQCWKKYILEVQK